MKLAFIFDTKFRYYAGHFYSVNLTENLWRTRYLQVFDEVVVVGRYVEGYEAPNGRLVQSDSEHVKFKCIENTAPLKRIFRQRQESQFIKEVIADCDAVVCRGWWGVKECRELNKNYMIEVISCVWDAMWNHSFLGKLVAVPFFLLQRNAVKNAPYVMYVSQEFLQGRYPTKGIHTGVTDTVLPLSESDEILTNRLQHIQKHQGSVILGTSAAVNVAYKGQKHIIKALSILKKKGFSNYIYQMAGSGDQTKLREYAKKMGVADQVIFLGAIPHEKVFPWLDEVDIYVQPSFQEGLSRAIVEAMSRGLPCIVSDAGGNPELIESQFVCRRKGNFAERLADAILSMEKKTMIRCAERNYRFAKQFSADKVNEQRIRFMKAFAEQRKNEK